MADTSCSSRSSMAGGVNHGGDGEIQAPHHPPAAAAAAAALNPDRPGPQQQQRRRNYGRRHPPKSKRADATVAATAATTTNASTTVAENPNRSNQKSSNSSSSALPETRSDNGDDDKKPPAVVAAAAKSSRNHRKPKVNNNNSNNNNPNVKRNRNRARGRNSKQSSRSNSRSNSDNKRGNNNDNNDKKPYPPHWTWEECWQQYNNNNNNHDTRTATIIRGKLRVLPSSGGSNDSMAFVACDRGSLTRDVKIETMHDRNRGLDGDCVFVELVSLPEETKNSTKEDSITMEDYELTQRLQQQMQISEKEQQQQQERMEFNQNEQEDSATPPRYWQDDDIQMDLWNPLVPVQRQERLTTTAPESKSAAATVEYNNKINIAPPPEEQRTGRVVYVIPPNTTTITASELEPDTTKAVTTSSSTTTPLAKRRLVGSLTRLQSGTILLTPNNRSLPQFRCPPQETQQLLQQLQQQQEQAEQENDNRSDNGGDNILERTLFQADYVYGSWLCSHKPWPPCRSVQRLGRVGDVSDEIAALLTEFQVHHGEFSAPVLHQVHEAVQSGVSASLSSDGSSSTTTEGWKPTPDMYAGRRDYREQRIFTIDPTTAKDLDDALHITPLPDGTVEVGVHIADVSYFVRPGTAVDAEAQRRATTVYLVDRTVPMLPRPLCEVACSLNEAVERLAFSCVWRMNANGTLLRRRRRRKQPKQQQQQQPSLPSSVDGDMDDDEEEDVWYGRTVICSCARLDYATAQNIIDGKVLADGDENDIPEELWPSSRRPTGGHTMQQVAADVRLMHRVAMARRRLRFENGALALDSVKLTFQLNEQGEPLLAAPYPIRDSNRLVEEYMLLANYLVAQRLLTHGARHKACLRFHPPPLMESLDRVAAVARAAIPNFELDITSSEGLHKSLVRLGQLCRDDNNPLDPLILKCVTQMLTVPMQQAQYFCTGAVSDPELWRHFALNMPYYTHFTSPIRRYPDILVHRLLQATIDDTVDQDFPQSAAEMQKICEHCSEMQKASKEAQTRCDRVFLSLYLRSHPLPSVLGIVLSVGVKAFTVYMPSLGADALLYLDEHRDRLTWAAAEEPDGTRRILIQQKQQQPTAAEEPNRYWDTLDVRVFTKVRVTVVSKDKPPIDMKLRLEGPWEQTGMIAI